MSSQVVFWFFWSVHVATFLLASVFIRHHYRIVSLGQTTHESNKNITKYNLGLEQNLTEVLGQRYVLAVFWPFATSRLPHDGVEWDKTKDA